MKVIGDMVLGVPCQHISVTDTFRSYPKSTGDNHVFGARIVDPMSQDLAIHHCNLF